MKNFKILCISVILCSSIGVLNAQPDSGYAYAYDSTVQAPKVSATAVLVGVTAVALVAIFAQPHNSSSLHGHVN